MSEVIWYNDILYTDIGKSKLMVGTGNDTGTNPNAVRSKEATPENLIIPSSVYLKTVTVIGRNAFSSCANIKSIFIPETIERIEQYSLEHLSSIVNITVAANAKTIFQTYSIHCINNKATIYFGGTKCQKENIINSRTSGYTYTVVVSPAYKCKTFGNFGSADNFTVDYSIKGIGRKLITCPKQRASTLHILIYLLLVQSA